MSLAKKFLVLRRFLVAKVTSNSVIGSCCLYFIACGFICQGGCQVRGVLNIRELDVFSYGYSGKFGEFLVEIFAAPVCYNYGMAYIRKFKTTSGATGVQVCYKEQGRVVKTVHVGSASSENRLEKLIKKAQGIIDENKKPLFNLENFNKK